MKAYGIISVVVVAMITGCAVSPVASISTEAGEFVELPGKNVFMGKTEVTQELWMRIMKRNPSCNQGEKLPVENVTLVECREFVKLLCDQTGMEFRLPTDEEWTYACSAGKNKIKPNIDNECWHVGNSGGMTHMVATKEPNAWGIYDMLGNVWEWTVSGESYGNRGGCYYNEAEECSLGKRYENHPALRGGFLGLRLILVKN